MAYHVAGPVRPMTVRHMHLPNLDIERSLLPAAGGAVCLVDEAGRGALSGPVHVGVVVYRKADGPAPAGIRDSKLLTAMARTRLVEPIRAWVPVHAVGAASAAEIDEMGIVTALRLAAGRAVGQLDTAFGMVLLDGSHDWLSPFPSADGAVPVVTRVRADRDCAGVAAAGILAKTGRDAVMVALDETHPGYGWARNKGYGTIDHRSAIDRLGPTIHHRTTWNLTGR